MPLNIEQLNFETKPLTQEEIDLLHEVILIINRRLHGEDLSKQDLVSLKIFVKYRIRNANIINFAELNIDDYIDLASFAIQLAEDKNGFSPDWPEFLELE